MPIPTTPLAASNAPPWIVCQIGAREHYAIARGLHAHGQLAALVTDAWVKPGPLVRFAPRLAGRYHHDLADAHVESFTFAAMARQGLDRLSKTGGTEAVMRRNAWFQEKTVAAFDRLASGGPHERTVFAYSYAALDILRAAQERGWRTVLGQIDPGPAEARIVEALIARHDPGGPNEAIKPAVYWQAWREETALADKIIVNSAWSREALIGEGVPPGKIAVVPLAYKPELPASEKLPVRGSGPLKALFLGQANVRKGIAELIEAANLLRAEEVEIHVVGPASPRFAERLRHANLTWHGPQPRTVVDAFYRDSDVFVFPTHSDGFGITQFEALAHGLPVIATRRCGEAVRDGYNGRLLPEITGAAIAEVLGGLARDRNAVAKLAAGARQTSIPWPEDIAGLLVGLQAVTAPTLGLAT